MSDDKVQSWGKGGNYKVPRASLENLGEGSLMPLQLNPNVKAPKLTPAGEIPRLKPVGDAPVRVDGGGAPSPVAFKPSPGNALPLSPAADTKPEPKGMRLRAPGAVVTPENAQSASGLPIPSKRASEADIEVVEDDGGWGDLTVVNEATPAVPVLPDGYFMPTPKKGESVLPAPSKTLPLPSSDEVQKVEKTLEKAPALPKPKRDTNSVRNRQSALISTIEDGWDEDNPAFDMEDAPEGDEGVELRRSSRGIRITDRDLQMVNFLARFRFATGIQMARYVDSSKKAVTQRLGALSKAGLVRKEEVTRGQTLWTPTAWGLSTVDLDFRVIQSGISPVTIGHTLGLVNIAIELETGASNILRLPEGVQHNRVLPTGEVVLGETLVTEREMRQEENRLKKNVARADYERAFTRELRAWRDAGSQGLSPEHRVGNEGMLIMWGTRQGQKDHVPDLVVSRDRLPNGFGGNFAIELELNRKSKKEWERILVQYKEREDLYAHVFYFTHKRNIKDDLEEAAQKVGLTQQGRFTVLPYKPQEGNLPFWG